MIESRAKAAGHSLVLALVAAAIATITGWLGGELVDRLGVDPDANLDAPASFKTGIRLGA